jgi:tetraacyldisaccharide 4'-kinase
VLERGVARLLQRTVVRRLTVPSHVAVVAVGGATLGGSGKTPLAIACAMELAAAGARVVLVGHAYRADPRRARFVSTRDALAEVGDEAILAARSLERLGGRVVVAPSRSAAMDLAAKTAEVLVLDGVGQLTPTRASLALLAVDAVDPWGARLTLRPGGILRAPASMLLGACDAVVPMGEGPADATVFDAAGSRPDLWPACVESKGARVDGGGLMTWEVLGATSVGLIAALARPERLLRSLASQGVVPRVVVRGRDHGPLGARACRLAAKRHGVDLWLATPKCALHAAQELPGVPVAILDHTVALPSALRNALRGVRPVLPALTQAGHTHSL